MGPGEAPSSPAPTVPVAEPDRGLLVVPIVGRLTPSDVDGLCVRASTQRDGYDGDQVLCDVGALAEADAVTVDALARVQLIVRRGGRSISLLRASPELQDLLHLMGLSDAVPCVGASGLESRREPEEREPARGVEEEGDSGDPAA